MFKKTKTKAKAKTVKHKALAKEFNESLLKWNAHEFGNHGEVIGLRIFVIVSLLAVMVLGLIYDSWTFSLAICV